MLAAIKLEVMTPSAETPDQGSIGLLLVARYLLFSFYSSWFGCSGGFWCVPKHNELIVQCSFVN